MGHLILLDRSARVVEREGPVKIGARIVRHGRCVVFQLAGMTAPRNLFAERLRRIERPGGSRVPAGVTQRTG